MGSEPGSGMVLRNRTAKAKADAKPKPKPADYKAVINSKVVEVKNCAEENERNSKSMDGENAVAEGKGIQ